MAAAKRWYDEKGGDAFGFEKGAFRMAMPEPNDAATRAWKQHAAPPGQHAGKGPALASGARAAGGPAPPFLAAPPVVAAAMAKANRG